MKLMEWVRLPSDWINQDYGLREFQWKSEGAGSDATAALMTLTAIAHHVDTPNGIAHLTYKDLCSATGISRAKLSNGLDILEKHRVIERMPQGRSTYRLRRFSPPAKWGKLPAQRMYVSGRITAFKDFCLRKEIELNALKLFLLLVARRNTRTNLANISYDKIQEYAWIERTKIKPAISFLASLELVFVEHIPSEVHENGVTNAYRIVGIDSYKHMGTQGRGMTAYDYGQPEADDIDIPF